MAFKRKLDDDVSYQTQPVKQMKLVPFPSSESMDMDMDIPMSDTPVDYQIVPSAFHTRLASSASSVTDASSEYSSEAASSPSAPVSQLPGCHGRSYTSLSFPHLRSDCKQIPKLRVSCGSGPNGKRSMWGICEECGAIEMLDS
ncbi:hypothetical protein PNOK_0572500 [Pyrrhoderma noxium]|uniref:Uncharacterized protein n=1 Tax=Pyrrhoderma noxium TaxID=2282107 RepID=A0A286UGZ2_9AGAM|nr:hypothetical protein PNOK_0572500 [Pyrrhoderma noxium]